MNKEAKLDDDEMLSEYDFSGGVRGRYASESTPKSTVGREVGRGLVRLEPDVAEYFADSASVNEALRALIAIARRQKAA